MWEDKEGRKILRVNEVDVLVGVVIGLGGDKGCTKLKLRRAVSWMTPLQLQLALAAAVQRGLLREDGNRYFVRMEEATRNDWDKPRHSSQVPPHQRTFQEVNDIYGVDLGI